MTYPVSTGGTVTLDGTGAGSLVLGPGKPGEQWSILRYSTAGASAVEPSLEVFKGAGLVDSTKRGNADSSEVTAPLTLWAGETLRFAYTGGTAGATMTVFLEGTAL